MNEYVAVFDKFIVYSLKLKNWKLENETILKQRITNEEVETIS